MALCFKSIVVIATNERNRPKAITTTVVSITLLQLLIITASWIIALSVTYDAFIYGDPSIIQVASVFSSFTTPKAIAFVTLMALESIVSQW